MIDSPTPAPARSSVDVIIAAWNRADSIERAVKSAIEQPEVNKVIVIDDASTDDTLIKAMRIAERCDRVVVHCLPINSGPSAARNKAIELSDAPWIALLDADDFLLPGRIAKLLAAATDVDFVADDILLVDECEIGRRDPTPMLQRGPEAWLLSLEAFVVGNVRNTGVPRREFGYLKPIIRRSFLDANALRYEETLRLGEDYALYAQALAARARFSVIGPCGYVSVQRRDSISVLHSKRDLEYLRDFDLKLVALPGLTRSARRAIARHSRSIDARVQWISFVENLKRGRVSGIISPFFRSPFVSWLLLVKLMAEMRSKLKTKFASRPLLCNSR